MKRNQIIIVTIFSVFVLVCTPVLATLLQEEHRIPSTTVIKESKVDQKELLFQVILDIGDNREIQKIIMNYELIKGGFYSPGLRFLVFTPQILTKKELNTAYSISLILSKTLSKSRMHSLLEQHQMIPQKVQKDVTAVLEKNATLNGELRQLSDLTCDCNKDTSGVTKWHFPILCAIVMAMIIILSSSPFSNFFTGYILILWNIYNVLGC